MSTAKLDEASLRRDRMTTVSSKEQQRILQTIIEELVPLM